MNKEISFYLEYLIKNENEASDAIIKKVQEQINFELPKDYIDLMREFNGGEGEIGENSWLCLFSLEDLVPTNEAYDLLMSQIPDYFLFGKDAADTGYAFHKHKQTIHSFGLMSNFKTDSIEFCGDSILDFIKYLYNQ